MTTRRQIRLAALASGLVALCSSLPAQYLPTPPRPYPGLINDKLRASDPYASQWDIGVNIRGRLENKDDAGFTAAGSNWDFAADVPSTPPGTPNPNGQDNNNTYFLTRIMPRVGYTDQWFQVFVEGRSSSSFDDERENFAPQPTNALNAPLSTTQTGAKRDRALAENDSDMNLHQGYLFVGNHKEFPVSAKLGRQELVYGDQRQVGHFRWNNNARTFDAAKTRVQTQWFGADFFTGGVVYNDNHNFNKSYYDSDKFNGAYFNFPTISSRNIVEAYLYQRDVDSSMHTEDFTGVPAPFRNPPEQELYTVGLRLKSKPGSFGPWDFGAELMHQFGTIQNVTSAGRPYIPSATPAVMNGMVERDQNAYAAILQGGYTWTESAMQPRLGFTYSYASGDDDATDGESGTFQNQFATTHLHYGYMDLNSLQNLHDFRTAVTVKPIPTVTVAVEHHFQFLDTTNDYWYNVAGIARAGGGYATRSSSSELGQEIDLVIGWYPMIHTHLELGVSHYFAGDYIEESLADNGGATDASYVYFQVTLNL
jgi:hypothetical protein